MGKENIVGTMRISCKAGEDLEEGDPVGIDGFHIGYAHSDMREGDMVAVDIKPLLHGKVEVYKMSEDTEVYKMSNETTDSCDYCDTTELVYRLESDRGPVNRCIECLAIEQIQQKLSLPFDVWIDRDDVEPPDKDKFPDAPEFDPFDPVEHDFMTIRAWATILARLKDDEPILERDPEAIGTVFEDTREFLTNFMGADAHKAPSELLNNDEESVSTDN